MLAPQAAWARLLPHLATLPAEWIAREDAAGRVLAAALAATIDVPGFDASAMDGYALAPGTIAGPALPVAGVITAGEPPGARLGAGAALRIMTGAPVPAGADRVVPIEATDRGRERVTVHELPPAGANVRTRSSITAAGDLLLPAGTLLTHGSLALLAAHGLAEVPVVRRPSCAMLTTGNEVVPASAVPGPGQLRDTHSAFIASAARPWVSSLTLLGIARDERGHLAELIERGRDADVLVVTGGVSMGELDLVEGVFADLGYQVLFDAIAIQPGKPMVAAVRQRPFGLVFGLPGNPASAMVAFWLFVRPALRRLSGLADSLLGDALRARLAAPLPGAKGRDRFLPAEIRFDDGHIVAWPIDPQGSHDLAAYARGTALVRVPAGSTPTPAGGSCWVLPLVDWPGV